jgi:polyisoprenoid-binding protein YceI
VRRRSAPAFRAWRPAAAAVLAAAILGVTHAAVAAAEAAGARRWTAVEGEAGFVLHTFWHDVEGTTRGVKAELTSASGDPLADGVVKVVVDAASLETGIGRRDRKMREEHLETATYPTIEFHSTSPPGGRTSAGEGKRFEVAGDLTLHGVTKPVTAPVEAKAAGEGWEFSGRLTIKMSDYQIANPSIALNKVRDEVEIHFRIRLERAKG